MENKSYIQYENLIIAFVDILGFSDLVRESKNNPDLVINVYQLLKTAKSMTLLPLNHKFKYLKVDFSKFVVHFFSDTITISCPLISFHYMNAIAAWIINFQQLMWAKHGTFIRGGISFGKLFDNEDSAYIFGPALVDAYDLESKRAKWPRVLVDEKLIDKLPKRYRESALREYIKKERSVYYIDYLHDLFPTASGKVTNKGNRSDATILLDSHKTAILNASSKVKQNMLLNERKKKGILKKYLKLSQYHNSAVERYCREISKLINNPQLIRSISEQTTSLTIFELLGINLPRNLRPKYSADNKKYLDTMPIIAIISKEIMIRNPQIDTIENPLELHEFFCSNMPLYLPELFNSLSQLKIDLNQISI